ncbi:MAG TPA: hypothetical protein PKN95_08755 [Verrucomicrobiota bacterium]|nr:hypothetical protein [Verrucomicrobiota bacterium]HNT15744.1 hypothetical protein [Verrucomicrobiota bacterium]
MNKISRRTTQRNLLSTSRLQNVSRIFSFSIFTEAAAQGGQKFRVPIVRTENFLPRRRGS